MRSPRRPAGRAGYLMQRADRGRLTKRQSAYAKDQTVAGADCPSGVYPRWTVRPRRHARGCGQQTSITQANKNRHNETTSPVPPIPGGPGTRVAKAGTNSEGEAVHQAGKAAGVRVREAVEECAMLDSMEKVRRSRYCALSRVRHWPVVARSVQRFFGRQIRKAKAMWKPSMKPSIRQGRQWIDDHKEQKVGMRVMSGPDIHGTIIRYDKNTVVLAVSGTPTPLLVSRDKIVMMYVIHETTPGALIDEGSPA